MSLNKVAQAVGMLARGASTTAVRSFAVEASAVCTFVTTVSAGLSMAKSVVRTVKSRSRYLSHTVEEPTISVGVDGVATVKKVVRKATAMTVRSPAREFFTLIVKIVHIRHEVYMPDPASDADVESDIDHEPESVSNRVESREILIVRGEVPSAKLLDADLPVVWRHDGSKIHYVGKEANVVDQALPPALPFPSIQAKTYLGMARDAGSPDNTRTDAMRVSEFGKFEEPGTLMLDRKGDESHLVLLPHDAVDLTENYVGKAAIKAVETMSPFQGIAIRLPMWWKLPPVGPN